MFKKILVSVVVLSTVGCASTTISTDVAQQIYSNPQLKRQLPKAQIMPSPQHLSGKQMKAIVLDTEEKNELAKMAFAGKAMSASIDNLLHKAGVDVVDRSISGKVKNEILAYESSGNYDESSLSLADVAILPIISSATFSYDFTEGYVAKNIITGKDTWVNPSCTFEAKITGVAKRYELPSLKVSHQVDLFGINEIKRDTRNSSCRISTQEKQGLIAEAAKQAIRNHKQDIQNKFSPKGYVTAYKVYDNTHYIKINIGKNRKLIEGTYVSFIKQIKSTDDLTGEINIDKMITGEGEITNLIQDKASWVVVDAEVAVNLSLGDIAQIEFRKGWLDHVNDVSQSIKSL